MKISKMACLIVLGFLAAMAVLPIRLSAAVTPLPDKIFTAPVMPGGTVSKTEDVAVEVVYDMPYPKVIEWYKAALAQYKDARYRDWAEQLYIEDQGGEKWHSIGIQKGGGDKTTVRIVKDNWTWIFSTLLIRFAGVFVVLCLLWILLNISNFIMVKFVVKPEEGKAKA
jgi:hypothetical protein